MTKFVGKFRKNSDYKDDYNYAKSFLKNKKRKDEHSEVKKQFKQHEKYEFDDDYEFVNISRCKND